MDVGIIGESGIRGGNGLGLYLHIPFCRSKCLYCDFYSIPSARPDAIERYVSALCKHIEYMGAVAQGRMVDSIFMGGGTPTVLNVEQFGWIASSIEKSFFVASDCEFTVEANPSTFDTYKISALRDIGVNRMSIGMQSANAEELRLLGRTHRAEEVKMAVDAVNRGGIGNFNLDLMYGIPSQTVESFGHTLEFVKGLEPTHISVYGLQLEEGTPLYRRRDKYVFPDEDEEKAMNRLAAEILGAVGYNRYEISNYAREGYECRHNLRYWLREDYLGSGAAAHSFFCGERYFSPDDIEEYVSAVDGGNWGKLALDRQSIDSEEAVEEYIMLRMRLSSGVSPAEFTADTGRDFASYEELMQPFLRSGHIRFSNGRYSFTPEGFDVSNYILANILACG